MATSLRDKLARTAPHALVATVPTVLLAAGIATFMLNHFFVRAPYLLDTGMLSKLTYRDGVLLEAPKVALNYVDYYYDVYFSPLTSLFSILSYLVPLSRLEWFVLVQMLVYAPIGYAVSVVSRHFAPSSMRLRFPFVILAAVAFSFSGLVLWMVGYPHLEAAMPGLTCVMLAALVTGRIKTAWVFLVLAASVRQDGGVHLATALAPVWFLHWRGVEMLPQRRTIVKMIVVAIGLSALGMIAIKVFFTPYPRLAQAYLGDPIYSHLSMAALSERFSLFVANNKVIYYPFLATVLVAALRRDPRYLLGWASTLPWFVFCFLAVEQVKATFFAYGVAPFLIGPFWVYLYGAHLAPPPRRLRAGVLEAVFTLVSLASTLGMYRSAPHAMEFLVKDMVKPQARDRAAVHAFAHVIRDHRDQLGKLGVDYAVATIALEYLTPADHYHANAPVLDTIAFHRGSMTGADLMPVLIDRQLDVCTLVKRTLLAMCTREPLPAAAFAGVETAVIPASFLKAHLPMKRGWIARFDSGGVEFRTARLINGWLGELVPGTYEWTVTLAPALPIQLEEPDLARLEVVQGNDRLAFAAVPVDAREIAVRFEAKAGASVAFRFQWGPTTSGSIPSARLRRIADAASSEAPPPTP